jgi:small subunit ribosomal protein S20
MIDATGTHRYKPGQTRGNPRAFGHRWFPGVSSTSENFMANTKSAKKATRVATRRTRINKNRVSRVRTEVRKVEEAITKGDRTAAEAALKTAAPELMRGAQKGVLHKNAASRKVSRLTKRVKALKA